MKSKGYCWRSNPPSWLQKLEGGLFTKFDSTNLKSGAKCGKRTIISASPCVCADSISPLSFGGHHAYFFSTIKEKKIYIYKKRSKRKREEKRYGSIFQTQNNTEIRMIIFVILHKYSHVYHFFRHWSEFL